MRRPAAVPAGAVIPGAAVGPAPASADNCEGKVSDGPGQLPARRLSGLVEPLHAKPNTTASRVSALAAWRLGIFFWIESALRPFGALEQLER